MSVRPMVTTRGSDGQTDLLSLLPWYSVICHHHRHPSLRVWLNDRFNCLALKASSRLRHGQEPHSLLSRPPCHCPHKVVLVGVLTPSYKNLTYLTTSL